MECWYCRKLSRDKLECFKREHDRSKNDGSKKDKNDKAWVANTKRDKQPIDFVLIAPQEFFIDSDTTVHMIKDVSLITGKDVSMDFINITAGKDLINAMASVSVYIRGLAGRGLQIWAVYFMS